MVKSAEAVAEVSAAEAPEGSGAETRTFSGLKVRLFEERDIPRAKHILRGYVENSLFKDQVFSERKVDGHLARALSRPPRMLSGVAEWQGECVGLVWAEADSFMLTDGPMIVAVHLIGVDQELPPRRRAKVFLSLIAAIRQWAKTFNASHSFVYVTTGTNIAGTDRLMKAAGAKIIGGAYAV